MKRVLVVDDDEGMRTTLEVSLDGYEVTTVESAILAQKLLQTGEYDVVLCDLMMPEMTGAELYDWLPADSPMRARFIFMTGGSLPIAVEAFVALATPEILSKPFTIAALREVVDGLVQESA
jgi:CheY-like chemotaxis protein